MDGPYSIGLPTWNPALEAWPGGPHPGAVVARIEEERGDRGQARKRKRRRHLLLLR